jgi:pimeloyl-ACP methyl ester carboxylesterase
MAGQSEMLDRYMPAQAALVRASALRMPAGPRRELTDSPRLEAEIGARAPFRRGPVKIIRAAHIEPTASRDYVEARRAAMAALARASGGEIIDAPTGHFVQNERPDIVIAAVLAALQG